MQTPESARDALVRAGISEPVRTELAEHPEMTAALVWRVVGENRGGKGALVQNLRAALEQAVQLKADMVPGREPSQLERVMARRDAEKAVLEREKARCDELDDAEFARRAKIGRDNSPPWLQKILDKSTLNPRKNRLMRFVVLQSMGRASQNRAGAKTSEVLF